MLWTLLPGAAHTGHRLPAGSQQQPLPGHLHVLTGSESPPFKVANTQKWRTGRVWHILSDPHTEISEPKHRGPSPPPQADLSPHTETRPPPSGHTRLPAVPAGAWASRHTGGGLDQGLRLLCCRRVRARGAAVVRHIVARDKHTCALRPSSRSPARHLFLGRCGGGVVRPQSFQPGGGGEGVLGLLRSPLRPPSLPGEKGVTADAAASSPDPSPPRTRSWQVAAVGGTRAQALGSLCPRCRKLTRGVPHQHPLKLKTLTAHHAPRDRTVSCLRQRPSWGRGQALRVVGCRGSPSADCVSTVPPMSH